MSLSGMPFQIGRLCQETSVFIYLPPWLQLGDFVLLLLRIMMSLEAFFPLGYEFHWKEGNHLKFLFSLVRAFFWHLWLYSLSLWQCLTVLSCFLVSMIFLHIFVHYQSASGLVSYPAGNHGIPAGPEMLGSVLPPPLQLARSLTGQETAQ